MTNASAVKTNSVFAPTWVLRVSVAPEEENRGQQVTQLQGTAPLCCPY